MAFSTGVAERFQKSPPINVILENILPPVAPVHPVINRARVFNAQLPGHAAKNNTPVKAVNSHYNLMDPFLTTKDAPAITGSAASASRAIGAMIFALNGGASAASPANPVRPCLLVNIHP